MTTIERVKAYRDFPAVSQTQLKALLSGKQFKGESLSMILGSYLDCLLTTPDMLDDLFMVGDMKRPTAKIVELCEGLEGWDLGEDLSQHRDEVEEYLSFQDYYNNRPDTRVDKFIKEAGEWWAFKHSLGDKKLITQEEVESFLLTEMSLKADPELDYLWQGDFQKEFYWRELEVNCKGLADIYAQRECVDIKYTTCATLREWTRVCVNLNYPFQLAFYKSGLEDNFYDVTNSRWLVVGQGWHSMVDCTLTMLKVGRHGADIECKVNVNGNIVPLTKHIPGYRDGLRLYKGEQNTDTLEKMYLQSLC